MTRGSSLEKFEKKFQYSADYWVLSDIKYSREAFGGNFALIFEWFKVELICLF